MKTKLLLITALALTLNVFAQTTSTIVCFSVPDSTASNNWSYKDYIIPAGFKIDSVFMDASRPGYPVYDYDFVFTYCAGTTVFNSTTGVTFFSYSAVNTSLYNIWLICDTFNYNATGMVRVTLPTNAGAIWNNLCFAISPINNSSVCFSSPDGTDSNNWSYKDYIIPTGYTIDSVYLDASRPGYPVYDYDFVFNYCAGTSVFNAASAVSFFSYSSINTSLYNVWLDCHTYNYSDVGMVRVILPTNAGAIWNNLCFAIAPSSTVGISEKENDSFFTISPNPFTSQTTITFSEIQKNTTIKIMDVLGKEIKTVLFSGKSLILEKGEMQCGIYFVQITDEKKNVVNRKAVVQ